MVKLFNLGEGDVHLGLGLALACVEQLGQAVQGLGAKHHVHERGTLDDFVTLLAGHAAAHANEYAFFLEVLDAAQVGEHFSCAFSRTEQVLNRIRSASSGLSVGS